MDPALRTIQRYLYIGSDVPFVFDVRQPLDLELGKAILGPVVNAMIPDVKESTPPPAVEGARNKKHKKNNSNPVGNHQSTNVAKTVDKVNAKPAKVSEPSTQVLSPVLTLIKMTIKNKTLCRTDECLFALAFCAREFPTEEERHTVYELLPELWRNSHDLFTFLSFYIRLATQSGHAGFGHGLRKAIIHWYDKFAPLDLAEVLVRSVGTAGWTHKDVIAKTHPKLTCPEKQGLIDAATKRTSQLQEKRAPEKKDKKRKANPEPVKVAATPPVVANTSKSFKRYQTLLQFKSATTAAKAVELIKQHGPKAKLELLPRHFRRSAKVWDALYPGLTYRELLSAVLPMQDFRLLMAGEANAKTYIEMLTKRIDALEDEYIHPIEVHQVAKLYEAGKRYTALVKETIHQSTRTEMLPPVPEIVSTLNWAMEHSFDHHPKTGARYFIALDLRTVYDKKHVLRSDVVTCFHASVMIAFSIFKREKNVTVVAFTDDPDTVANVEFRSTMGWEEALKCCEELMLMKTKFTLGTPIKRAIAQKARVDVFITVTDSLVRVNPTRTPPVAEMQDYRKKLKLNLSRYVAISLNRHSPSFDFPQGKDTSGILEIVGYSANNAKIIEAFAKNHFF